MFKSCVVLFVLSTAVVLEAHRVDNSGYKVLSIKPKTEADLDLLHKLGKDYPVDLWNEPRQTGINLMTHLKPELVNNVEEVLRKHKIEYDVALSDLISVIDSERIQLAATNASDAAPSTYSQYNAVNKKIIALMEGLAAQYPSIAKLSTIVKSYEDHLPPIYNLRSFGDCTNKVDITMGYGLHAREWSSVAAGDNKIILIALCLSLLVLFCEAGGKGKGSHNKEVKKKESKEEDSKEEQDSGEEDLSTTSSSTGESTNALRGMESTTYSSTGESTTALRAKEGTTESGNEGGSSNGTESSGSSGSESRGSSSGTESSASSNGTESSGSSSGTESRGSSSGTESSASSNGT